MDINGPSIGSCTIYAPALSTSLLSSFAFKAAHALLVSQSSLPQQHVQACSGSGDERREALVNALVRSSMFAVARCRLLVSCESGVRGRESKDIASQDCRMGRQEREGRAAGSERGV